MRASGATEERLFGPEAVALAPRGVEAQAPTAIAVAFRAAALDEGVRGRLAALPSASFTAEVNGEVLLECDPGELEGLAAELQPVALLVAAIRARKSPRPEPAWMGIVNVTPDSFSDGGRFLDAERAIEHGLALEAEGASILDIGGESTRPGADPVALEAELRRVLPVIEGLARRTACRISIDTRKAAVARAAVEAGAGIVNDVSAGRADPDLIPVVAELGCELVLMHSRGEPSDMQRAPSYSDPVREITEELRQRAASCLKAGVRLSRMTIDPGIGFGKRLEDNLDLLRRLPELRSLGLPLCVGVSRKSFIAHATGGLNSSDWAGNRPGGEESSDRSGGSAAAVVHCALAGVDILRVHEVARMREAAVIALAIHRRNPRPAAGRSHSDAAPHTDTPLAPDALLNPTPDAPRPPRSARGELS